MGEYPPLSDEEMNWVAANSAELQAQYGGQWIAVVKDVVVAHGEDLVKVGNEVDAMGIIDPYFEWIDSDESTSFWILAADDRRPR